MGRKAQCWPAALKCCNSGTEHITEVRYFLIVGVLEAINSQGTNMGVLGVLARFLHVGCGQKTKVKPLGF